MNVGVSPQSSVSEFDVDPSPRFTHVTFAATSPIDTSPRIRYARFGFSVRGLWVSRQWDFRFRDICPTGVLLMVGLGSCDIVLFSGSNCMTAYRSGTEEAGSFGAFNLGCPSFRVPMIVHHLAVPLLKKRQAIAEAQSSSRCQVDQPLTSLTICGTFRHARDGNVVHDIQDHRVDMASVAGERGEIKVLPPSPPRPVAPVSSP